MLVELPVQTMQRALIAAFSDDDGACEVLRQAASSQQLKAFCRSQPEGAMAFVLDNVRALPLDMRGNVSAEQRAAALLLKHCSEEHHVAGVTSIGDKDKHDMYRKKEFETMLSYGGLTAVSSPTRQDDRLSV